MAPRIVVRAIAALALAGCEAAERAPLAPTLQLILQQAPRIFTINSTGDEPDPNLGQAADDGLCDVDLGQAGEQCTLRAAIENAIETTRDAEYRFDLGAGVPTIQVGSSGLGPLPPLLGRAVIDGSTGGSTLVELDGSQAGSNAVGLQLLGGSSIVRKLVINRFSSHGILIAGTPPPGGGGHVIEHNLIGTSNNGNIPMGNGGHGVFIEDTPDNTVRHNVISANMGDGVHVLGRDPAATGAPTSGAHDQEILDNVLGTNPAQTMDLANGGTAAVVITSEPSPPGAPGPGAATHTDSVARNTISGRSNGIVLDGHLPRLIKAVRNLVGLGGTGATLQKGIVSRGNNSIDVELNQFAAISDVAVEVFARTGANYNIKENTGTIESAAGFAFRFQDNFSGDVNVQNNTVVGPRTGLDVQEPVVSGRINWNVIGNEMTAKDRGTSLLFRAEGEKNFSGNTWRAEFHEAFRHESELGANARIVLRQSTDVYLSSQGDGQACRVTAAAGAEFSYTLLAITSSGNGRNGLTCDFVADANARVDYTSMGSHYNFNAGIGLQLRNQGTTLFGVRAFLADDDMLGNHVGLDFLSIFSGKSILDSRIQNNRDAGIVLRGSSEASISGSTITGNGTGVLVEDAATASLTGNTFTGNGTALALAGSGGGATAISANSFAANVGLAIDLANDGVTANDPGDGDVGPNGLQNFPVLTSIAASGGMTTVQGTLNSTPNGTFTLEFFGNTQCDPSGFGEGEIFLGSLVVTTDAAGNAPFTTALSASAANVTATATDAVGNTSEFSLCLQGTPPPPPPGTTIASLIAQVRALGLSHRLANSLLVKLNAAEAALNRGKARTAINQLRAFMNQVRAQRGKGIRATDADALLAAARQIIAALRGP